MNDHDDEEEVKKFAKGILNNEDDTDKIPDNKFFKGFWDFALWGYIPPLGFEEYKCALITTVVDDSKKQSSKNNGRAESKAKELERRTGDIALDKRGIPSGVDIRADKGGDKLVEILSKGRIETMMQKKFVLSRDKFDLQMAYKSEEIRHNRGVKNVGQ